MAGLYVMLLDTHDGAIDWISYSRAHFLETSLPSCEGIYTLSNPPSELVNEPEGWMVFMIAHGNKNSIGGLSGTELANRLTTHLPKSFGMIHLQSCNTGAAPAKALTERLSTLGHDLVVKAPASNATFTLDIGFRALDVGKFGHDESDQYKKLIANYGQDAKRIGQMPTGTNLSSFCRGVALSSTKFWTEFSILFKGVAKPTGTGWNAYKT